MYKVRFIISSKAGSRGRRAGAEAESLADSIRKVFEQAGRPVDIVISSHEGHVAAAASQWQALHGDRALVYVCGGDGSINEVASVFAGQVGSMGVIPFGTGNDFARGLYGDRKIDRLNRQLVQSSLNPEVRKVDTLSVNGRTCVNVFSLGYDTEVLDQAYRLMELMPELGRLAYPAAVLKTLFNSKVKKLDLEFTGCPYPNNGELFEERVKLQADSTITACGNSSFYGSGFCPFPHADITDGWADLLFTEPLKLFEFIPLIGRYRKTDGSYANHPKIKLYRVKDVTIQSVDREPILANIDGIILKSHRYRLEVCPKSLNLAYLPHA